MTVILAIASGWIAVQALALIALVVEIKGLRRDIVVARIVTLPEKAFEGVEPPLRFARRRVTVTAQPEPSE